MRRARRIPTPPVWTMSSRANAGYWSRQAGLATARAAPTADIWWALRSLRTRPPSPWLNALQPMWRGRFRATPMRGAGSSAQGGFAPGTAHVRAATWAANVQASVRSSSVRSSSRPPRCPRAASRWRRPAVKESPAPTVSTTTVGGAGTATREPSSDARAPRPPSVMTTRRVPAACQVSQASSKPMSGARRAQSSSLRRRMSAVAHQWGSRSR